MRGARWAPLIQISRGSAYGRRKVGATDITLPFKGALTPSQPCSAARPPTGEGRLLPSPIRSGQGFFKKNETRSFRVVGGKEKILLPRTLAGASSLCVQQESFPFVWLPERLASPARGRAAIVYVVSCGLRSSVKKLQSSPPSSARHAPISPKSPGARRCQGGWRG